MKTKNKDSIQLKKLLKEHGTEAPTEGFSLRLMNMVATSYKLSYSKKYSQEEKLGKWIIAVLIGCSVLVFSQLKPTIQILILVLPILFLGLGVVVLVLMLKNMSKR